MNLVLKYGVIAQLGERLHGMQEVIGSIPISSTISRSLSGGIAQLGEHLLCKQRVIGSIPFTSTIHILMWGYSSVGRASALQAEGHRFDPVYLHHQKYIQILICCSISQFINYAL